MKNYYLLRIIHCLNLSKQEDLFYKMFLEFIKKLTDIITNDLKTIYTNTIFFVNILNLINDTNIKKSDEKIFYKFILKIYKFSSTIKDENLEILCLKVLSKYKIKFEGIYSQKSNNSFYQIEKNNYENKQYFIDKLNRLYNEFNNIIN